VSSHIRSKTILRRIEATNRRFASVLWTLSAPLCSFLQSVNNKHVYKSLQSVDDNHGLQLLLCPAVQLGREQLSGVKAFQGHFSRSQFSHYAYLCVERIQKPRVTV